MNFHYKTCTFFGHKDTTEKIKPKLQKTIEFLITNCETKIFYVGHNGNFDFMVINILTHLLKKYDDIRLFIVLSNINAQIPIHGETILPESVEKAPKRFAIDRRNRWMVENSSVVITYVEHNFGGAAKFKEMAEKKEKCVINIATIDNTLYENSPLI